METNELKEENVNPSSGLVQLSPVRLNVAGLLLLLFVLVGGIVLFNFVWDQSNDTYSAGYNTGYKLGLLAKMLIKEEGCFLLILWLVLHLAMQYVLLYLFTKRDYRSIRFISNWVGFGWIIKKPIALKYYRVTLVIPSLLLGWLPALHGFCTGSFGWFALGLWGIACAFLDYYFLWRLRPFNDEDKIVNVKQNFAIQIIKQGY